MTSLKVTLAFLVALSVIGLSFVQFAQAEGNDGKAIFESSKCATCHSVDSQGIAAKKKSDKTPDLSELTKGDDMNLEFWTKYLKKDATLNGKKHAIPFKGSDEDLKVMVEWLMSLKK